jgi:hypothetical protein
VGGGQYGYDPLTHGGYGAVDDYAPYPHITSAPGDMDYQQRAPGGNVMPQRQDYSSDPYAAVHKPKKRMDQHIGKSEFRILSVGDRELGYTILLLEDKYSGSNIQDYCGHGNV